MWAAWTEILDPPSLSIVIALMKTEPYSWTVAEAGRCLRKKDISPLELTTLYLERIDELNPTLHAYITIMHEHAVRAAENATKELTRGKTRGPLHGIPVSVKDSIPVRDCPTTCGTQANIYRGNEEAAVVGRLREAGAVILGKTSLPELGLGSFHAAFPPVRNPWALDHSGEGSSIGCAAAIAARLSMASVGADAGGSIRRPAAHCGITGFKPTYALVETEGVAAFNWSMEHLGPLALSAEDTYLTMMSILPPERTKRLRSWEHPRAAVHRWREHGTLPRLGVVRQSLADNTQVGWEKAFEEALNVLRGLGMQTREVSVPSFEHSAVALMTIILVEAASAAGSVLRDSAEGLGEEVRFSLELGASIPGYAYVDAHRLRSKLMNELHAAFDEVDVLAGPVTCGAPPLLTEVAQPWTGDDATSLGRQTRPTAIYNMTGMPAISLPCGFSPSLLPMGFQLAARRYDDGTLLAVSWLYEQETQWQSRIPPMATMNAKIGAP
jgi:aspartyl-tRNA(Asn)/glutamyl-tRNA(Gln) amidotransferase subunit A